jgi:hypothetical protein
MPKTKEQLIAEIAAAERDVRRSRERLEELRREQRDQRYQRTRDSQNVVGRVTVRG